MGNHPPLKVPTAFEQIDVSDVQDRIPARADRNERDTLQTKNSLSLPVNRRRGYVISAPKIPHGYESPRARIDGFRTTSAPFQNCENW